MLSDYLGAFMSISPVFLILLKQVLITLSVSADKVLNYACVAFGIHLQLAGGVRVKLSSL